MTDRPATRRPAVPRRAVPRRAGPLTVALLAGALVACGGASEDDAAPAAPVAASGAPGDQALTVLGTEGLDFEPAVIAAAPGTLTLTLANEGGPPHDLAFSDDSLPSIGAVGEGQEESATYVFESPGTYDFVCTFHPGMQGQVVVS